MLFSILSSEAKSRLDKIDGDKIYIEQLRRALDTTSEKALWYCEKMVRDGVFERWYEYVNPENDRPLHVCPSSEQPPEDELIYDDVAAGHGSKSEFTIDELTRVAFYRMPK